MSDEMEKRLKAERERLGLTQPQLAAIAGVAKRTVIEWEKGVTSPTGAQLTKLAGAGIDVSYVLTAVRGVAKPGSTPADIDRLNHLIDDFFALPPDSQDKVLAWASGLVVSAVKRGEAVGIRRRKPENQPPRPSPAAGQQPSVHEELAPYVASPPKPSEAA